MSNVTTFDGAVPAFLQNRAVDNSAFSAGVTVFNNPPTIEFDGRVFTPVIDGVQGTPALELQGVLLSGKPTLDRAYYIGKFDPNNTTPKAPDCTSDDGIRPKADSPLPQCEACAGCQHNQFGSAVNADGSPSKGKACRESKRIALFAFGGTFKLKITGGSLGAWGKYVREAELRGIDLSTGITKMASDPSKKNTLQFNWGGYLQTEAQVTMIDNLKQSPEVADIVGAATPALAAPAARAAIAAPVVAPTPPPVVAPTPPPVVSADPFAAMGLAAVQPAPPPAEPEKPKVVRAAKKPAAVVEAPIEASGSEFDNIIASLGLPG